MIYMSDLKQKTGRRIKGIREGLGLSLARFGEKLSLGKTAVHQYESGMTSPSLESLTKIAELGNVTLDWLITGKDRSPKTPAPTKDDALRMILTSDTALIESVKTELRSQVREETPTYNGLTKDEQQLLNEYRLMDAKRKERLIDTAIDMSTALLRESDQEEKGGGKDCAESNER